MKNMYVFTYNSYEALGVDLDFLCHHLNVNPTAAPNKQLSQHSSTEDFDVVKTEVLKL